MNIASWLMVVLPAVQKYGPKLAPAIPLILKGDWVGLATYLEQNLLTATGTAGMHATEFDTPDFRAALEGLKSCVPA